LFQDVPTEGITRESAPEEKAAQQQRDKEKAPQTQERAAVQEETPAKKARRAALYQVEIGLTLRLFQDVPTEGITRESALEEKAAQQQLPTSEMEGKIDYSKQIESPIIPSEEAEKQRQKEARKEVARLEEEERQ